MLSVSRLPELTAGSALLLSLAERASDRLTLNQAAFFLYAARADLTGKPTTRTELLTVMGVEFRTSLRNSYRQLLGSSRVYPQALGWLKAEANGDDLRQQLLRLTPVGAAVISNALEAQAQAIMAR